MGGTSCQHQVLWASLTKLIRMGQTGWGPGRGAEGVGAGQPCAGWKFWEGLQRLDLPPLSTHTGSSPPLAYSQSTPDSSFLLLTVELYTHLTESLVKYLPMRA